MNKKQHYGLELYTQFLGATLALHDPFNVVLVRCLYCGTIHIWQTHPSVTHCKHYWFHHGWSSSRKSRMVCNGST